MRKKGAVIEGTLFLIFLSVIITIVFTSLAFLQWTENLLIRGQGLRRQEELVWRITDSLVYSELLTYVDENGKRVINLFDTNKLAVITYQELQEIIKVPGSQWSIQIQNLEKTKWEHEFKMNNRTKDKIHCGECKNYTLFTCNISNICDEQFAVNPQYCSIRGLKRISKECHHCTYWKFGPEPPPAGPRIEKISTWTPVGLRYVCDMDDDGEIEEIIDLGGLLVYVWRLR
jgi:hypothetical protein